MHLDVLNPSWIIFSEGFRRDAVRQATKRVFDILASLALVLITWPFMLLTMLAIMLEDGPRAPILYRQRRVGLDGHEFDVLKFRSMRVDAERDGQARWATGSDDRVTRVGRIIRKIRIDELPQIFNVLRGDMSFVGPRPERPQFVAQLAESIPYYDERHCAKPGITGWAQVCYPVRLVGEGCAREAAVRPVLREESQSAVRSHDPPADRRSRAAGQRVDVEWTHVSAFGLASLRDGLRRVAGSGRAAGARAAPRPYAGGRPAAGARWRSRRCGRWCSRIEPIAHCGFPSWLLLAAELLRDRRLALRAC